VCSCICICTRCYLQCKCLFQQTLMCMSRTCAGTCTYVYAVAELYLVIIMITQYTYMQLSNTEFKKQWSFCMYCMLRRTCIYALYWIMLQKTQNIWNNVDTCMCIQQSKVKHIWCLSILNKYVCLTRKCSLLSRNDNKTLHFIHNTEWNLHSMKQLTLLIHTSDNSKFRLENSTYPTLDKSNLW